MEEKKDNAAKDVQKEKLKSLQLTLDKLDKEFGKGTIMRMSDKAVEQVPSIPTGSIALDVALGIDGLPRGRVIEIFAGQAFRCAIQIFRNTLHQPNRNQQRIEPDTG